jgi:pilus assembly protein CpaF
MNDEILDEIRNQVVAELIKRRPWIPELDFQYESQSLRDLTSGLGPLTDLLERVTCTDLFINSNNGVWIKSDLVLEKYDYVIEEEALVNFIRSHALRMGKHFDQAHPAIDLELAGGIRLHALLPPLVEQGIHVSVRINQQRDNLVFGSLYREILTLIIQSKKNFLISGGTGSGKTTFLSHLIDQIPQNQRILVIEDTREIQASHCHMLRLQARTNNSEGLGAYSVRELIREALRMRPDRIYLGEVRGSDVLDLLLALNTGHEGSGGTIHANSPRDVPNRVAALAMTLGIPREGALALFASSIELIIHLDGKRQGNRISSISQVVTGGKSVFVNELISVNGEFSIEHYLTLKKELNL